MKFLFQVLGDRNQGRNYKLQSDSCSTKPCHHKEQSRLIIPRQKYLTLHFRSTHNVFSGDRNPKGRNKLHRSRYDRWRSCRGNGYWNCPGRHATRQKNGRRAAQQAQKVETEKIEEEKATKAASFDPRPCELYVTR